MTCETARCFYIKSPKNHISSCVTAGNVTLNSVCRPQFTTSTTQTSWVRSPHQNKGKKDLYQLTSANT